MKKKIILLRYSVIVFVLLLIINYLNRKSFVNVNETVNESEKKIAQDYHNKLGNLDKLIEDLSNKLVKKDLIQINQSGNNHFVKNKEHNEDTNQYDYLKKYPFYLECKTNYKNTVGLDDNDYSKEALNDTHNIRIVKGVVVYFPIDKTDGFFHEFKWLYRSWIEMIKYEPSKWRTDLVVFIENDRAKFNSSDFFLNQLNCSFDNRRTSANDKPMCTLINYIPIRKRELNFDKEFDVLESQDKYKHLLKNINIYHNDPKHFENFYKFLRTSLQTYSYVDSILMAFDGHQYFKTAGFDFLIRSDMDVFLTPLFALWLPKRCNDFYVGGGAYSNTFNRNRLKRIAKDLGLAHYGVSNLGSTWYSTPDQFKIVSYLTLVCMAYLNNEEFSQPEREGKLGVILWPEWHYGVLLLYGQNLAMNHLIGLNQTNVVKIENYIDYPSGNELSVFKVLHIHVFHGDSMFSKFQFKVGNYDKMEIPNKENATLIKYYSLKMALEGKRIESKDLLKQLNDETNRKD